MKKKIVDRIMPLSSVAIGEKYVAPALGCAALTFMFYMNLRGLWLLRRDKGNFSVVNPFNSVLMFFNACCWIAYAYERKDFFLFFGNCSGVVLSLLAITIIHRCYPHAHDVAAMEIYLTIALIVLLGLHFGVVYFANHYYAANILGYSAMIAASLMFAAPLATVKNVIDLHDASSIFLGMTIAQLLTAVLWAIYGLSIHDYNVAAPNFVGIFVSTLCLFLKSIYPSKLLVNAVGSVHTNTIHHILHVTQKMSASSEPDATLSLVLPPSLSITNSSGLSHHWCRAWRHSDRAVVPADNV
jgi:hypothetical protein